jgi:hypothetical protein
VLDGIYISISLSKGVPVFKWYISKRRRKNSRTALTHLSLASARYCRPVIQPAVRHCIDSNNAHTVLWF